MFPEWQRALWIHKLGVVVRVKASPEMDGLTHFCFLPSNPSEKPPFCPGSGGWI
jgi:hypothetical protein